MRSPRFSADPVLEECSAGATTLRVGSRADAVTKLQQALMDLGYSLRGYGPDGVFGRETATAVAAFNATLPGGGDGRVAGSATLAALDKLFASGAPPAADDRPHRATGAPPPDLAPADPRQAARLALAEATAGAHFLAGATGELPAQATDPPASVTLVAGRTDPAAPAVFAAQSAAPHQLHVCAGRFDARNGGMAGGRPAQNTDTDLIVYLAGLSALPEEQWKPFFQFFSPRCCHGAGFGERLVWGEDCRAKRHFDGAGLVNWCLAQAAGSADPCTLDMAQWAGDASGTEPVALDDPPRTGDLVLRAIDGEFTQIGWIADASDADNAAGDAVVVLAEQPSVGVVMRRFSPAGWTVRRRLRRRGTS
jgi:hypothetical protein